MKHTQITTLRHLANYLHCEVDLLKDLLIDSTLQRVELSKDVTLYKIVSGRDTVVSEIISFSVKKKNPSLGVRTVHSVRSDNLQNILKILNTKLKSVYTPNSPVHGFVSKRNIKTNAQVHLGKKKLLSVDIKDFFESIKATDVAAALVKLGFNNDISYYISLLVTLNGKLTQGYNTSPTIANIVSDRMDREIEILCGKNISYSRYADDMYFSTDEDLPTVYEIERIVDKYGFILNHKKTRYMFRGGKQYVTGLTVFDSATPRIPKRIKRNLRLELYYIATRGYLQHALNKCGYTYKEYQRSTEIRITVDKKIWEIKSRITGWIYFIKSVEPATALKLQSLVEQIRQRKSSEIV